MTHFTGSLIHPSVWKSALLNFLWIGAIQSKYLQVNLFQKHLFLNKLTHNMTTDCAFIPEFSTRKIQVENMMCTNIVLKTKNKKQCLYTTCSEVVFFLYWSQESMNNLSLYCGLTDWRMSASDTDLPVTAIFHYDVVNVLIIDLKKVSYVFILLLQESWKK